MKLPRRAPNKNGVHENGCCGGNWESVKDGFNRFEASIGPPLVEPAPTIVS